MKPYTILKKDKDWEVRKYPPSKRTVKIFGRYYFLQFPYVIFGWEDGELFVWFANESNDTFYEVPLPNIEGIFGSVCLDEHGNTAESFEEAIKQFWSHEFNDWLGSENTFEKTFKRFHSWAKLPLDQVMKTMVDGQHVAAKDILNNTDFYHNDDGGDDDDDDDDDDSMRGRATEAKTLAKDMLNISQELKNLMAPR